MRMAYKVVKFAILHCIPEASNLWFDPDRLEIMLLIDGEALPFNSLSAGQKMMVALIWKRWPKLRSKKLNEANRKGASSAQLSTVWGCDRRFNRTAWKIL
jgi:hypothetical protein